MKKIIITTGDADGIGLEVTIKALLSFKGRLNFKPYVFIPKNLIGKNTNKYLKKLKDTFNCCEHISIESAISSQDDSDIVIIASDLLPPIWVEQATRICLDKNEIALVTAPLSKTLIKKSGLKDVGHTEIFKRISKIKSLHMGFIGSEFSTVLATDHIPLMKVGKSLTTSKLTSALLAADALSKMNRNNKPIGILGLNPHAGESGILGSEEVRIARSLTKIAQKYKISIQGPLVPDAAFSKQNFKKFSCYLALYHDQGLIPFKLIHGQDSGVHITLGLPFIRTSVDHGTAKDIFDKNIANPNSMIEAIEMALKLTRRMS